MTTKIGNAPCSRGIEFPSDLAYPTWQSVLDQCAGAGYKGVELGPIGYMPEDPNVLAPALADRGLERIGGVVFRAFHDPAKWDDVIDASVRTCKALVAHRTEHLALIDSISPRRAHRQADRRNRTDGQCRMDRVSRPHRNHRKDGA